MINGLESYLRRLNRKHGSFIAEVLVRRKKVHVLTMRSPYDIEPDGGGNGEDDGGLLPDDDGYWQNYMG